MDARTLARAHALSRAVLGAAMTAAPALTGAAWVGTAARRATTQVPISGMGARDVGIGLGAAAALGRGAGAAPWLRAGVLADAVDLVATLRARETLPAPAVAGVSLMAASSAALGAWLQARLD